MPETYQDRRKIKQTTPSKSIFFKLGRLLLKQTAASLVCLFLVLGIRNAPVQGLNNWADALGNALRYEADLSYLSQIKERWFSPKETNPMLENTLPLMEQ